MAQIPETGFLVIADLTGYTALTERLDPEEISEIMSRVKREAATLVEQRVGEDPARLVAGERLVPVRRRLQGVPADDDAARLLCLPEPDEEVREADDRARLLPAGPLDRLRQRVVGAVRQRVAVDDE